MPSGEELIGPLIFTIGAIIMLVVSAYFRGRDDGKKHLITELLLDGYDVEIWPAVKPGKGRYVVRVWREHGWTPVKR